MGFRSSVSVFVGKLLCYSVCLSVGFISPYMSVRVSEWRSVYMSVRAFVRRKIYLSVCVFDVYLSVGISLYLTTNNKKTWHMTAYYHLLPCSLIRTVVHIHQPAHERTTHIPPRDIHHETRTNVLVLGTPSSYTQHTPNTRYT